MRNSKPGDPLPLATGNFLDSMLRNPRLRRVRICVVFNPVAKGDKARLFRSHLDDIARQATLKLTRAAGDARSLAAESVREGFDVVVAAGGDGTLNEVLNGIGDVPDGFAQTRLGVLPLGTVNVFARELRIPLKLEAAWKVILAGRETAMDLPKVEFGPESARACRYFAQLAGAGLDARAIQLVDWRLKKKFGPLAYVYAGLKALMEKKSALIAADSNHTLHAQLVLVGNGRLYGGDFQTFDQARMNDGLLDVCVFPKVNFFTLLRCVGPLLFAGRLPESVVQRFQAATFSIVGNSAFELDGELIGDLPAVFTIEQRRLRVLVP